MMRPLGAVAGGVVGLLISMTAAQAADPPKPLEFKVLPYAGARLGDASEQAQPGAMVEFGPGRSSRDDKVAAKLKAMGVKDGAEFGDRGRWYTFVAGSGAAVGLNMRRDPDGLLRNYGLSVDPTAAIGDTQAGVGWRKGDLQASVGYVHRTFKPAYGMQNIDFDNKDEMVGVSFALKARPR